MNGINVFQADRVLDKTVMNTQAEINGKYVIARPIGFTSIFYRLKWALRVFRCKADVIVWYKQ